MSKLLHRFREFDRNNPMVYELFKQQTFRAISEKRKKVSAYQIIEWIRWEIEFRTVDQEPYKISNDYKPFYARKFVLEHPHYFHIFDFQYNTKNDFGEYDIRNRQTRLPL